MSFIDSIKNLFAKKDNIPGLPEDMNSVDEIKTKLQENVNQDTVNKVTDAIPGEVDDQIADKVFDQNQSK